MRRYKGLLATGAILALFFLMTCGLEDTEPVEKLSPTNDELEAKNLLVPYSWEELPIDAPGPNEFQANTYTSAEQYYTEIAVDASGNFVAVWISEGQDGSASGVYGQRFNSIGTPQGAEFQANSTTAQSQTKPSVAMDADGDFVVAWQSYGQDGDQYAIIIQRYNAAGVRQGSEILVNTTSVADQENPEVAMDGAGNFVVIWESEDQDGDSGGIYGQRFNASGVAQGGEFLVNTYTTGDQGDPDVAMDTGGDFVVTWASDGQDGSGYGIIAQRYNSAGAPQGSEIIVNTETGGWQIVPSIDADSDGNFGVTWQSFGTDGDGWAVSARLFNSDGSPVDDEFVVNTYATSSQENPCLAMSGDGNFVISWQSQDQDGGGDGIYGQEYAASGAPVGVEFSVNTYTADDQQSPAAIMISSGSYVIVWQSYGQDESSYAVMGRLFGLGCENDEDCEDGDICTDNTCDLDGMCQTTFNSDPCDDLLWCNGDDTCDDGSCSLHTGDPCDPELFCNEVTDTCDPQPPDEPVVTFTAPSCITLGAQSRFDVLVDYFVPDGQALKQAQFQLGYDWTLVQVYDPPILSIPGQWDIDTPQSDIVDWTFERDTGEGGGVLSGESLTYSLEILVGNEPDDTEVVFWLYGDENGAQPYEWGPFVNDFVFCATTTTVAPTTTSTIVTTTSTTVSSTSTTPPTTTTTIVGTTSTTTTTQGSTDIVWIPIPAGSFEMGCSPGDAGCVSHERPPHTVNITAFEMSQTEITQQQYLDITGESPSFHASCPTCPVELVDWYDARDFCQAVGAGLPTEAQWEYAARAGTTARFICGDDAACLDAIAWYSSNSGGESHIVATLSPNLFGLNDMLGNVWEWVNDWYDANYYSVSPADDPTGPASGVYKIFRGGSWAQGAASLRVSHRIAWGPETRFNEAGFRCARSQATTTTVTTTSTTTTTTIGELTVTFSSPDCIEMGQQARFDVQVDYWVPDDQAIIQTQFQLGYDWTLIQAFDPPILSVPGVWDVTTPSADIINWTFIADGGTGFGGVRSGESITFSLDALVGFEPDDFQVIFSMYGDENGAPPFEWGPFNHDFNWCVTTTTTSTSTSTSTTVLPTTTTTTSPTATTVIPTTTTTSTSIIDELVIMFTSPDCIEMGQQARFDVQVDYWVPDDQAIILAQFQLGYDWTLVEAAVPPTMSVPGEWIVTTPSADIVNWTFEDQLGYGFGGVLSGESITFSLDAVVGNEFDDTEAVFYMYGDENGAQPYAWGPVVNNFEWCTSTTTTSTSTTSTTTFTGPTTTSTTSTTMPDEVVVTFTSPECIEPGEISRFDVEVYYWVPDDQAIILAQFQLGYDWTFLEAFDPPILSIPGHWYITTPSLDIVEWTFEADNPDDFGGVVSGETITFSLEAIVGNELDDDTAVFAIYGDENGAPPYEWGPFEQAFEWCATTTTTVMTTTSTTTTTDEGDDDTGDDDTADDDTADDDTADDDFDDDFVDDDIMNDDTTDDDTAEPDPADGDDDDDNDGCGSSCGC